MSLDPRRIAVLGIGYGAVALATLGFMGDGAVPPAPTLPDVGGQVVVRKAAKALPAILVPVRVADAGQGADALAPTIEVVPNPADVGRAVDSMRVSIEIVAQVASMGESVDTTGGRGPIDPAITLTEAAAIMVWMRGNA